MFGKSIRNLWNLRDDILFLNNGSFGATPKRIIEANQRYILKSEEEPVIFFVDNFFRMIRENAVKFSEFLGTDAENLVFVDNATTGINTVLFSLLGILNSETEILTSNHVYPAVKNAINHYCRISGAKYREFIIPFPVSSENEIIDALEQNLRDKTRLVILDHITSATALVLPVKKIAEILKSKNILFAVDGAHAPGILDLNINDINADWYTGNLHKWLFSPKGAAVLNTKTELHNITRPTTISLFSENSYSMAFDWTGTKSQSSFLAASDALDFYLEFGKENIQRYQKSLMTEARDLLCNELEIEKPAPDSMLASMATLEFPFVQSAGHETAQELRRILLNKYNTELFTTFFDNRLFFRISCQIFNYLEEYEKLADSLKEIKNRKLLG